MAAWSELEVDLIIEDYFQMLHAEIKGIAYNKAAHRDKLLKLLNNRTAGSIEFKHCNISAVLINNGMPYIEGYKPRGKYQTLLEDHLLAYVASTNIIEKDFDQFAEQQIQTKPKVNFANWLDTPPEPTILKKSKKSSYRPVKRNYLELEQKNRSVGRTGEKLALDYEKWGLINAGYAKLAKEIEWTSDKHGDGAGYDILSRNVNGSEKYIEVKTTTLGKETPILTMWSKMVGKK